MYWIFKYLINFTKEMGFEFRYKIIKIQKINKRINLYRINQKMRIKLKF